MNQVRKIILETQKSKSYIKYNKYHSNNVFGITGVSRWELMHSNFIAWLISDNNNSLPKNFAISHFITMLAIVKEEYINNNSRWDENLIEKFYNLDFINSCEAKREEKHVDILIKVKTKENKILPIIIENKVNSGENGKNKDQTTTYFAWAEEEFRNKPEYYNPVYVYLEPCFKLTYPKQKEYIHITYQHLVDYVIEPVLNACSDEKSIENIRNYLQCLSFQNDFAKGDKIMAISTEERKIIEEFKKENKNLIEIVINSLDDIDDITKTKILSAVRDNTKYSFNGKEDLAKNRTVLEIVKKYKEDKNPSFDELKNAFPDKLQGSSHVVMKKNDVRSNLFRNYFINEVIKLSDGTEVVVSNQWGKDNIDKLLKRANELGYTVEKSEKD